MSLPVPYVVPLAAGLGLAIVHDLWRRRVPNLVCAFVLVFGFVARTINQGTISALLGLAAGALAIALLLRPWQMGGIGGGDVKLAAATAVWFQVDQLVWFALAAALAGGVVAAVCYLFARPSDRAEVRANMTLAVLHQELPAVPSHRRGNVSVPYAVAIAAGAAFVFLKG
jgi:prepilin peptidase CpaA